MRQCFIFFIYVYNEFVISRNNNDIFQLLLKYYINLNIVDDLGNTCYHYAVINNRLGYLKQLLKLNGDANAKNNKGQTPLYLACLYGRYDIVRLYLEYFDIEFNHANYIANIAEFKEIPFWSKIINL